MRKVLITGATGNVGFALARKLLSEGDSSVVALVREGRDLELRSALASAVPGMRVDRLSIVIGDLRRPFCGVGGQLAALVGTTDVVHAAADVRWTAPGRDLIDVNVLGTEHLIDLATLLHRATPLRRVSLVSSAYVTGTRVGNISESIELPPGFNSGYEISKYLAERLGHAAMSELPMTIVRPTIVIGDSRTGEIRNFTTLYKPMSLLLDQRLKILPVGPGVLLDFVPVDYVADTLWALHDRHESEGRIFTIGAGSQAVPVEHIWPILCESLARVSNNKRTDRPGRLLALSPGLRQDILRRVAGLAGVKMAALAAYLPYLTQPRHFSRAGLDELGIAEPPPLATYADTLWRHYLERRAGRRATLRPESLASDRRRVLPALASPVLSRVLVIGGTGLLGRELVRQLIARGYLPVVLARGLSPNARWIADAAEQGLAHFIKSDITLPDLGLAANDRAIVQDCDYAVHLAADYRLSGTAQALRDTNQAGTANVLALLAEGRVRSLHYVSSITAAGTSSGRVLEVPITVRPTFRNHYEESKWLGEQEVIRWGSSIPRRIYRPGIIIGHSKSGWTSKFDGPYPALRWMSRLFPFPVPRGGGDAIFPLVFVDDVARCLIDGIGVEPVGTDVMHIVDPDAPTLAKYAAECRRQLVNRTRLVRVPDWIWSATGRLPGLTRTTGLEREALEYMKGMASFDLTAYLALRRDATACPSAIEPASTNPLLLADRYAPSILFWKLSHGHY